MSDTVTVTLSGFLLARFAEDARGWHVRAEHGDPQGQRIVRDCEAKRQIVEMYEEFEGVSEEEMDRRWDGADAGMAEALYRVCSALATVYADHPDYREEWPA